MSALDSLKAGLPAPLRRALGRAYDSLGHAAQWPQARFHPWRADSIRRMAALRDRHRGERCFIIGNGPSLRNTDLTRLKNERKIGMNRIFLLFDELGWKTDYLCSINDLVIEQSAAELQALDVPRFFAWRARKWLRPAENLYFLWTTYTGARFATDLRGRIWEGATVTNVALQAAYYLGFQEVVLIGVDHNFTGAQGKPNTTVVSTGDDPNHFSPAYFGKGFRWQLPDLEVSEQGYHLAREAFERDGRRVLDATVGGKLTVFPKVDYNSLF